MTAPATRSAASGRAVSWERWSMPATTASVETGSLPQGRVNSYLGYLQQYTHNVNLLRWLLDAGDNVRVRAVDLNEDGYTGIVVLDLAGTRATLETGSI